MKTTTSTGSAPASRREIAALLREQFPDSPEPHVWQESEEDAAAPTARRNPAEIIRRAARVGLVTAPGVAIPVDRSGGEKAAALCSVKSRWMDITPAMAQDWLHNNFRNRAVSEDTVTAYARDMVNGLWIPTHQGIAFNARDELIDGQHRLLAIIKAGKTVRMMVTFGLPCEIEGSAMTTMDAVDRGRTRSVADQLKIQHGLKDGSLIASVSTLLGSLCCNERTRRLSVGQTLDIYRAFQAGVDHVIAHRTKQHGLRSAGVLAGFAFAMSAEGSQAEVAAVYYRLTGAEIFPDGTPLRQLRDFLTSPEIRLLQRGGDRGLSELVLQTLWLEARGAKVPQLQHGLEGADHFRGLQPERVAHIAKIFRLPN